MKRNNNREAGLVDERQELSERRQATTIINMLPEDPESALRVLDHAKELVGSFLLPQAERKLHSLRAADTVIPIRGHEKGGH